MKKALQVGSEVTLVGFVGSLTTLVSSPLIR
jgi:hypothetical protein